MGASQQNISLLRADLSGDIQTTKAKQAFNDMPREVLNKLSADVHNIFWEHFLLENFPVPNREKQNPYAKLMQIQNLVIAIQSRNVISKDDIEKLIKRTCSGGKQRPGDLHQLQ